MQPHLALAEHAVPGPAGQHWLRLALPPGWSAQEADAAEEEGPGATPDGLRHGGLLLCLLGPRGSDVRDFLMAYSAGLLATATFIA